MRGLPHSRALQIGLLLVAVGAISACGAPSAAPTSGSPSGLAGWILGVMDAGGYVGVAALVALEVVFPPLPSEPVLLLGGFLAGEGRLSFPGVVAAATVGSVTGALALYWLGSLLGEERLRGLIRDYGRWAMVKERDLDKAVRWFERHGGKAVFFGRLAPVVRSLVSVPAGVARMPLGLFLLYTTLGSLLWNSVSVGLGWWLGDRWELVTGYTRYLEYAVLAALVLAVVLFVWRRAGRGAAAGLR